MALKDDKTNGFKIELRADIASGAWTDTFDTRTPLWESLMNCRSDGVGIEKVYGAERIAPNTVDAWKAASTNLQVTGVGVPGVCVLSTTPNPTLLLWDGTTKLIRAIEWSGTALTQVATLDLTLTNFAAGDLTALSSGEFAFLVRDSVTDLAHLRRYSYDGTFSQIGTEITIAGATGAGRPGVISLGSRTFKVATYIDGLDETGVYTNSGTAWAEAATLAAANLANNATIVAFSTTQYAIFSADVSPSVRLFTWDGAATITAGASTALSGVTVGSTLYAARRSDGKVYLCSSDDDMIALYQMDLTTAVLSPLGAMLTGTELGTLYHNAIAVVPNTLEVASFNSGNDRLYIWDQKLAVSDGPIRGMLAYQTGISRRLVWGDLNWLYRFDEATSTAELVGKGFTGSLTGGGSIWDGGNTDFDDGATTWDSGAVQATLWSMASFYEYTLATNGINSPQISHNLGHFSGMVDSVVKINIDTPGSGYEVGDFITGSGGGGAGLFAEVSDVDGSGAITGVKIIDGGAGYTSAPTLTLFTALGAGGAVSATIGVLGQLAIDSVQVFTKLGPHVVGFNTSADKKEFIWCSDGDPLDWIPTQTNSAGFLSIAELDTEISAAVPLGESILAYGQDQVFTVNYVGQPYYFTYRPQMSGIGAVSKGAVVSIGRKHVGLSWRGFFITDGVSFEYVDEPAVHDFFRGAVEASALGATVGYHNALDSEVIFTYPVDPATYEGLVFNYKTGDWHQTDGSPSYGIPKTVFSTPVVGMPDGRVLYYGESPNFDQVAIHAVATTKAMHLGDADIIKEIDQLRIGFTGNGLGLSVRIGWAENENDAPIYGPAIPVQPGYPMIHTRVAGAWITVELSSNTLNSEWRVESVDVIGRYEGPR